MLVVQKGEYDTNIILIGRLSYFLPEAFAFLPSTTFAQPEEFPLQVVQRPVADRPRLRH